MSETEFRIGPWGVNPALNLIERDTRSVRIEPRAMDVLVFLATHNQVVSVDELIASVWKGAVVGDGSVYLAINQLRQALDDPAGGTRYIETIPKRGYRLTVPVERVEPAPAPAAAPAPAPAFSVAQSQPRASTGHRFRWGMASVVGVLILGALALFFRDGAPPVRAASVAVLPFDNLSSDPEQAYFADGITVEVLNSLSRIRDLRVTGRTSSFQFRDRSEDLRSIGEALGVEHILEGTVRRSGDQVRITAQLSSAKTGQQLWSRTFERGFADIFTTQDEIARSVAGALQIRLGVGDLAGVPGMTRNVAAYDEYLRGMALNLDERPESFPLAIARLQHAVSLDPSFSPAWAGLSNVYTNGAMLVPLRAEDWRSKAAEALDHARTLTPDAPHVLLEVGVAEARRGNWSEAAAIFEQLEASYSRYGIESQAWGPRGAFLLGVGRAREALPALERAREDEPLAPAYASFLSLAESARDNLAGALAEIERGLRLEGLDTTLERMAFAIALTRHDRVEAKKRLDAIGERDPGGVNRRMMLLMDQPASAAAEIRRLASAASLPEMAMLAHWAAYYREPELSLELLSQAAPHLGHPAVLWQPLFRDVRKLPAFKDLVRDMGFVNYWRTYGWADFCHPTGEEDFVCE